MSLLSTVRAFLSAALGWNGSYSSLNIHRGPAACPQALYDSNTHLNLPIFISTFFGRHPFQNIRGPCDLPPNQSCHFTDHVSTKTIAAILHIPDIALHPRAVTLPRYFDKMIIGSSEEPPTVWHLVTNHKLDKPMRSVFGNRTIPFDAMSTYHLNSEVPHLYSYVPRYVSFAKLEWEAYQTPPPADQEDAVTLVVGRCSAKSKRCNYVRELSKYVKVVTTSRAILQKWTPAPGTPGIEWKGDLEARTRRKRHLKWRLDVKKEYIQRYKVHLAFENSEYPDYVSEKLHHALHSGVLPVYRGSSDVYKFFPPSSMINANDMTPRELGLHLVEVFRNKTLFDSYHAWRYEPFPQDIINRLEPFVKEHWSCRVCKFVLAKNTGRGWDQAAQRIVDS